MSFDELLRKSRSSPHANLHKFLTNYDPTQRRVYAFVEGDADQAFYRAFISTYLIDGEKLYLINCEGKKKVFEAHVKVIAKYPACRTVLFFVDKDVDDLTGKTWPQDPRIHTTDWYSIENYVVCGGAVELYFRDFVKVRRATFDLTLIASEFEARLLQFHRAIQSLMAWIIVMRRSGHSVVLNDVKLEHLVRMSPENILPANGRLAYLETVTKVKNARGNWREVRHVFEDLCNLNPKTFVRGKFEVWFLVEFVKFVIADLTRVAAETGGGVSVHNQLHLSNATQLMAPNISIPPTLQRFLDFHLTAPGSAGQDPPPKTANKLLTWVRGWFS